MNARTDPTIPADGETVAAQENTAGAAELKGEKETVPSTSPLQGGDV